MVNNKMLSVAIPTYNREKELKQTLENILGQIEKNNLFDDVEIVISDNASPDKTKEVVEEFIKKYPNLITYYRNETNVGWKNFKIVSDLASAKYVWFCSDDDIIYDGILSKLISVFSSKEPDYCLLNSYSQWSGKPEKSLDLEDDVCFDNISDFFNMVGMSPALITANIFSKKILAKTPFISYTWYHIDKLFNYPHNSRFCIISEPYIRLNPKQSSWINEKNSLIYNIEIIEAISVSSLPIEVKIKLYNYYKKFFFRYIYKAKKNCKNEYIDYDILAEKLSKTFAYDKKLFYLEHKILKFKKIYYLFYKIAKIQNMLRKNKDEKITSTFS